MSTPLGFEQQGGLFSNTEWACGAYSFGHLLNLLGISNTIDENKRRLKTEGGILELPVDRIIKGLFNRWADDGGTDDTEIGKQINKIGKKIIVNKSDEKDAKKLLDRYLESQIPLIINVDDGAHWMVVAGKYFDKYIVIDSADKNDKTISYYSWNQLQNRWACWCDDCYDKDDEISDGIIWCEYCESIGNGSCSNCEGTGEMDYGQCRSCKGTGECNKCEGTGWLKYCEECKGTSVTYYGIGLKLANNSKYGTTAGLKKIDSYIDDIKVDVEFQEYWGFYLSHLEEIFELNLTGKNVIRAAEFFDKYSEQIVENVNYWVDGYEYDTRYELDGYRFVAEFYNFKFRKKDTEKILIEFTAMFTVAMAIEEEE